MGNQVMNINCSDSPVAERPVVPDLAELDRILASLDWDGPQRKIATNHTPANGPKSQEPVGFEGRDQALATVASLPSVIPLDQGNGPHVPADTVRRPKAPSLKLQRAIDKLLPSMKKSWRRQWPYEKLARSFQVAEAAGGITFTLNLSPKIQRTLFHHSDPVRGMSGYINRECKRRFGKCPPYGFIFEVSDAGRLHLHGVVIPDRMDEGYIKALDKSLMKAGGRIKGARIVQYMQSYLDLCYDGLGWAAYVQKTYNETTSILQTDKVTFISHSLGRRCRPDV